MYKTIRLIALLILFSPVATGQQGGAAEDEDYIDPTRPTVLESATTPKPGVLQFEYGVTSYYGEGSDAQRASPFGFRFAPNKRIRLDFDLDVFTSQREEGEMRATGVGDAGLAAKYIFRTGPENRLAFAVSYAVKLPSANSARGLGTGRVDHNLRFIFQRTPGKNDFVFNASYLNVGGDDGSGGGRRRSGAQAVLAYGRELPRGFTVFNEIYGQTVAEPAGARGLFTQSVLAYKISRRFRLDGGVRFGFGPDAPRAGVVGGLVVGVGNGFGIFKDHQYSADATSIRMKEESILGAP